MKLSEFNEKLLAQLEQTECSHNQTTSQFELQQTIVQLETKLIQQQAGQQALGHTHELALEKLKSKICELEYEVERKNTTIKHQDESLSQSAVDLKNSIKLN